MRETTMMMIMMMTFFDVRGSFCVFLHLLSTFYLQKNHHRTHFSQTTRMTTTLNTCLACCHRHRAAKTAASSSTSSPHLSSQVPSARHFRTRKSDSVLSPRVRATPPEEDLSAKEILEQVKETTTKKTTTTTTDDRQIPRISWPLFSPDDLA